MLLGGAFASQRKPLLMVAGAGATVAVLVFADQLTRPFGAPTAGQIEAIIGAIALEVALLGVVVVPYRRATERELLLAVLLAVGIHFIPMTLASGPLCAGLGVCTRRRMPAPAFG